MGSKTNSASRKEARRRLFYLHPRERVPIHLVPAQQQLEQPQPRLASRSPTKRSQAWPKGSGERWGEGGHDPTTKDLILLLLLRTERTIRRSLSPKLERRSRLLREVRGGVAVEGRGEVGCCRIDVGREKVRWDRCSRRAGRR